MNLDENPSTHHHFLEQKKRMKQTDLVQKLGSQLTRGDDFDRNIKDLLLSLIEDQDYLYAKIAVFGATETSEKVFEEYSDSQVCSQVTEAVHSVEKESLRTLIFKMVPLPSKVDTQHELFRVRRSYDCFAVCKPVIFGARLLGYVSGVKANVGSMNPKSEQALLTMIANLLSQAITINRSELGVKETRVARPNDFKRVGILGNSKHLENLFETIKQVAFTDTLLLLQGEPGIGKNLFARCIHDNSKRASSKLVTFDGSVMDEQSIDKALFGSSEIHGRSGAVFEAAGGTLYIDCIDILSLKIQAKLLKFIKEGEYQKVGSDEVCNEDLRLIVSSSSNLMELVERGEFLAELYYSIAAFPVIIPSLKDRKSDIIPMSDYYVEKFSKLHGKTIDRISTPAIDMLSSYHWPGNVRELEGCIERAVVLTSEAVIRGHHLPPSLQKVRSAKGIDLKQRLESVEKELILDALKGSRGNMAKAARSLGLTERVMGLRVSSHGINAKKFKSQNT